MLRHFLRRLLHTGEAVIKDWHVETWDPRARRPRAFPAEAGGDSVMVFDVEAYGREKENCPVCGVKGMLADSGTRGLRRWRSLDVGESRCFIESKLNKVVCPEHGVLTENVPWARYRSRFTKSFEDMLAHFLAHGGKRRVSTMLRVAWITLDGVTERVWSDLWESEIDPQAMLKEIEIDSCALINGRGRATVVADRDTGRLIWAGGGTGKKTLSRFFESLTPEQRAGIKLASWSGTGRLEGCVAEGCPNARIRPGPYLDGLWPESALAESRRKLSETLAREGSKADPGAN